VATVARVYAKISLEMWGDEKFCRLSPLPPSGQSLWLYLLVGRFRTNIPGICLNVGIGALSDRLGWRKGAVENSWSEIETLGMAVADWDHGVIWMPNGITHNPPENPNVIRGWSKQVLPECPLMVEALVTLYTYIQKHLPPSHLEAFRDGFWEGLRKGFPKGFPKGFGEGLPKGFPKGFGEGFGEPFGEPFGQGSGKQEQEQEQEQEKSTPPRTPPLPRGGFKVPRKPTTEERHWAETFRHRLGCPHEPPCVNEPQCIGKLVMWRRLEQQHGMAEEARMG
jgi:hypothetical protein